MRKIAALFLVFVMTVTLCACSKNSGAKTSNEMTVSFLFGDRKGEYIGEIDENGLPDGYGIFKSSSPDGTAWTYSGDWEHGHWNGQGCSKWETGQSYSGSYTYDTETGYGTYTLNNGNVISGAFAGGSAQGYCSVYIGGEYDGYVFFGNFSYGKATGVVYAPDGTSVPATCVDGAVEFDMEAFGQNEEPTVTIPETTAVPSETEPSSITETKPAVTTGMKNALRSAESYLRFTAFSRSGLIDQLKFDQYTDTEAEYAVDNCGADWYEQAEKRAKEYLDFMSFSRGGLIDQLVFDGFTKDQATHGADANGM